MKDKMKVKYDNGLNFVRVTTLDNAIKMLNDDLKSSARFCSHSNNHCDIQFNRQDVKQRLDDYGVFSYTPCADSSQKRSITNVN